MEKTLDMIAPRLADADPRGRFHVLLFLIFLSVTVLLGGASRADALSQPFVRVAAILMILASLLQIGRQDWQRIRLPVFFVGALAGLMMLQLIPLPPALWGSMPGHSFYADSLNAAGLGQVWRPLSMTPDLTLNSLLALLPLLATILALAMVPRSGHPLILTVLLGAILLSALLGLLQIGNGGPYFYQITNEGSAVGVFANRNHQAVFLACSFPLLACWSTLPQPDPGFRKVRIWIALCMAAAIFPLLLITGSRAGVLLGIVGAALALPIAGGGRRLVTGRAFAAWQVAVGAVPLVIGLLAIGGAIFLARDVAVQRLIAGEIVEDRTHLLPVFMNMVRDFFPFGSGFGSFDAIYRHYEPHETLALTYLNHAHNDFAETLIEGGAAALLLVILFLLWFLVASWRLWATRLRSLSALFGRTGTAVALLILLSSLVDYPLRTPLQSMLMGIACFWMLRARDTALPAA